MSVNMDMSDDMADYADFEYQHEKLGLGIDGTVTQSGNINFAAQAEIEPLAEAAGLDNNEVAELVFLAVHAYVEPESEAADQNVASATELRGVVGINLPADNTAELDNRTSGGSIEEYDAAGDAVEGGSRTSLAGTVDDRLLEPFATISGPPFDDEANGLGGSVTSDAYQSETNYRDLVGRGPVLDSTDQITINARLVTDDSLLTEKGNVIVTMVWDTAEVSDAGRAFSVPSDD